MDRYDVAIIGTGPGGLEAAINCKIRNKSVLLLGSKDLSFKMSRLEKVSNYLGLGTVNGSEMNEAFKKHIDEFGLQITEDKIQTVYAMGDYFALQGKEVMYEASAVILATGVVAAKPIKGENEYLGRGVSYCATCDAPLYRGKDAVVVGYSVKEEEEANFLAEIANKVYYLPVYKDERHLDPRIEEIAGKPLEIKKDGKELTLVTDQGEITSNGVFILRDAVSAGQLVPGLETDGAHVVVYRQMKTNIKGLFACGDITGLPYQIAKAVGEGNVAALSAVSYLASLRRN